MAKKKNGKHLRFYIDCMNNGAKMPLHTGIHKGGLCLMVETNEIDRDLFRLFLEGQNIYHYWADTDSSDTFITRFEFNVLRQTIVLFMAAINGEL